MTNRPGQKECFASVIIAVHNDWLPLDRCLQALTAQQNAPTFEIIVVDDGSTDAAPASLRAASLRAASQIPLEIIQVSHSGISRARNQGIRQAIGEFLVFIDADCIPESNCLAHLCLQAQAFPRENYFQLYIRGELSTLSGRAEELRLIVTQDFLLEADGHIRYLNTSGFAIRRLCVDRDKGLFDERVQRAEDTLVLAGLIEHNELPLLVPSAIVRHGVNLSVAQSLFKTVRSAYLQSATHAVIASKNIQVRVNQKERLKMLHSIWRTSKRSGIGRSAFLLLIARQSLRLLILGACRMFPGLAPRLKSPNLA